VHRRHQLGAVAVGQHRVAELAADRLHPVLPFRPSGGWRASAAAQHLVRHGRQQRLLVGEVVVERARLDAELSRQPTHGQVAQAVCIEQPDGPLDDVLAVVAHPASSR